jgi:hypothetical protein
MAIGMLWVFVVESVVIISVPFKASAGLFVSFTVLPFTLVEGAADVVRVFGADVFVVTAADIPPFACAGEPGVAAFSPPLFFFFLLFFPDPGVVAAAFDAPPLVLVLAFALAFAAPFAFELVSPAPGLPGPELAFPFEFSIFRIGASGNGGESTTGSFVKASWKLEVSSSCVCNERRKLERCQVMFGGN